MTTILDPLPTASARRSVSLRRSSAVALTLFAIAFAGLAVSNRATAQLTNGSFESNGGYHTATAEGWALSPADRVQVTDVEGASEGSWAVAFGLAGTPQDGTLSQTFATVAGQTYTVQFDFGAFSAGSTQLSQFQVEVRDGSTPGSGTETINAGSAQIAPGTSGGSIVSNTSTLQVKDETAAAAVNGPAPNEEFSAVTFTFTALSSVSTLVFTDQSTGGSQDAVLDNVRVTASTAWGSFESPVVASGSQYNPPVSAPEQPWTFTGNAGVARNVDPGSPDFGATEPTYGQYAFVQGLAGGSFAQTLTFSRPGVYELDYLVGGRTAASSGGLPNPGDAGYSVTVSSGLLAVTGTTTTDQPFTAQSHTFYVPAAGTYTLTFANTSSEDVTAYFDNVNVFFAKAAVTVLATTGPGELSNVPGEPAGTTFTQLGLASMDDGAVGARVKIKPPSGAEVSAIFLGDATNGRIVARGGDPAPDGNGGTLGTFASFGEPVFGKGQVAFTATLAGVPKANDTGLWSSVGGTLVRVGGEGQPAPGADGNPLNGAFFDKIQGYALSADGEALSFVATLKGANVTGATKTGVWQQRLQMGGPATLTRLIFRTGDLFFVTTDYNDINDPFDDTREARPVQSLKLFVPAKTIPGQRRSYSSGSYSYLFVFAKFAAGREALLAWYDDGYSTLGNYRALENTNVGHPGMPSINDDSAFAMRAGLSIGAVLADNSSVKITAKNDQAILTGYGNFNIGIHSQEGSRVSGSNPEIFTEFDEPAFNNNYNTAFFAKVKAPGLPASQQRVLVYDGIGQFNYDPTVIARTGIPAADLTGGVLWKEFTAMALPDSDFGPVFLAKLSGPGVTPKNNIGLWATDLNGHVRLLLRTGDTLPVNGVDKTVSLINTLGAALDSPGQGRYVDLLGHISATLTFTDGTTALVHFGM